MSIRAIAQEVYKCQARVHTLEDTLNQVPFHEQDSLKEELRKAKMELKQVKNMLDNRKETPLAKRKRFPFHR
ncbi:MAG: hypothetical protein ABR512_04450 [Desulfopila sp.]